MAYSRHGLYDLTTQTLGYYQGGAWVELPLPGVTLRDVADAALSRTDVRDIWCRALPPGWFGPAGEDGPAKVAVSKDGRHRAASYDSPAFGRCYLHEWGDDRWPGATHPEPRDILATYDALSDVFGGRPFGFTPATLGLDIMGMTRRKHKEWFTPESLPVNIVHPRQTYVRLPRYDDGPYIHCYDIRSAFLAAARSLNFPTGAAMHLNDPRLLFGSVGFATAEHAGIANLTFNRREPGPLRREGWHAQSLYRAALAWGQAPVVTDAYVFAQRHQALRTWADTLLDAMKHLYPALPVPARPVALAAWKAIYLGAIGRLASHPDWGGKRWYQLPVWHAMIEGEAFRRAWGLVGTIERPLALCLLSDTVLIPSYNPDPGSDAPAPLGDAPGQLRHCWTREGISLAAIAAAKRGDAVAFRDAVYGGE